MVKKILIIFVVVLIAVFLFLQKNSSTVEKPSTSMDSTNSSLADSSVVLPEQPSAEIAAEAELAPLPSPSPVQVKAEAPPAPKRSYAKVEKPIEKPAEAPAKGSVNTAVESPAEILAPPPASSASLVKDENKKAVWFWLGANLLHQNLNHQMLPNSEASFSSVGQPGAFVRAGFEVNSVGLDIAYESSSQAVSSSGNITVVNGQYNFESIRAEGTWKIPESNLKVRVGLQRHTLPFIYLDLSNSQIYLRKIQMTDASVGLQWQSQLSKLNRLEAKAVYEIPTDVSTLDRSSLTTSAKINGHVSLGLVHSLTDNFLVGLQAQYQIQSFSYQYRDTPGGTESSGEQTLQSEGLILRFGWEY